jgi:hypothetical protein
MLSGHVVQEGHVLCVMRHGLFILVLKYSKKVKLFLCLTKHYTMKVYEGVDV